MVFVVLVYVIWVYLISLPVTMFALPSAELYCNNRHLRPEDMPSLRKLNDQSNEQPDVVLPVGFTEPTGLQGSDLCGYSKGKYCWTGICHGVAGLQACFGALSPHRPRRIIISLRCIHLLRRPNLPLATTYYLQTRIVYYLPYTTKLFELSHCLHCGAEFRHPQHSVFKGPVAWRLVYRSAVI